MELSTEQRREIERIMRGSICPRSFECKKSGFENMCRVRLHEDTGLIQCVDSNNEGCDFCARFDDSTAFCCCRVRAAVLKNLGI